jgi:hypothetical protein
LSQSAGYVTADDISEASGVFATPESSIIEEDEQEVGVC